MEEFSAGGAAGGGDALTGGGGFASPSLDIARKRVYAGKTMAGFSCMFNEPRRSGSVREADRCASRDRKSARLKAERSFWCARRDLNPHVRKGH